jgi:hypothetical protein
MPERPIWLSGAAERPKPGGGAVAAMPEGVRVGTPAAPPPSKGGGAVIFAADGIGADVGIFAIGAEVFTNPEVEMGAAFKDGGASMVSSAKRMSVARGTC